ncbi:LPXTG cell wall anchor domain-containing protein [Halobacillus sp. B29]|uniref:LPXTG cell wall anchor domain-containing protein n=1 Tax=Halobacillus sp. B29 TaxID=3457432 RepID=UPI003FCC9F40
MLKKMFAVGLLSLGMVAGGASAVSADEDKDCGDFSSGDEVMQYWNDNNFSAENDPDRLDNDSDGQPCENLTEDWEASEEQESNSEETSESSESSVSNDKDCDSFENHEEVMAFWYENGYDENNDPHDLDRDNDNLPCEVSQSEWDSFVADKEDGSESNGSDEDTSSESDEEASAEQGEEGGELPDTSSNNPLMMLAGLIVSAGAGLFLILKKQLT